MSPSIRVYCGACAGLGVWMIGWLAEEYVRIEGLLPQPMSVQFWQVTWAIVFLACLAAAACGRDLIVRLALGSVAVASGMGIVTAISSQTPMGEQAWAVGQAVVLLSSSLGFLLSPMRSSTRWPHDGGLT